MIQYTDVCIFIPVKASVATVNLLLFGKLELVFFGGGLGKNKNTQFLYTATRCDEITFCLRIKNIYITNKGEQMAYSIYDVVFLDYFPYFLVGLFPMCLIYEYSYVPYTV